MGCISLEGNLCFKMGSAYNWMVTLILLPITFISLTQISRYVTLYGRCCLV